MSMRLILGAALAALVLTPVAQAADAQATRVWKDEAPVGANAVVLKLADQSQLRIDVLAENLFRVRVSPDGVWSESGMNRYGVFKADWPAAKFVREGNAVKTSAAEITVDEAGGALKFKSLVSEAAFAVTGGVKGNGYEVRFPLAKDERVYGLGDVNRKNIQRRPGRYEIYVKNVNSYIPIPMAMTSKGWGLLMNTTFKNHFDVGEKDPDAMICSAAESRLDGYVFFGKDYRALLDIYTQLTGRSALLPAFGYGFTYVCNQNIREWDLMQECLNFRNMDFPCDVVGLEPYWMSKFYDDSTRKWWRNESFHFPFWAPKGPHTFIGAMNRRGFKLSLWLCVDYDLFRYEEQCRAGKAKKSGGLAAEGKADDTEVWLDDRIADADFAKTEKDNYIRNVSKKLPFRERAVPEGMSPWFEHLKKFVAQGAQCFKLDCSSQGVQGIRHPGKIYANNMHVDEAHNLYPLIYAKQMARGFEDYTAKRAMVYSSCGYAGLQQYVATWAGDTGGGEGVCVSLLNLSASGLCNQSCDMAIDNARSLHFGMLQPWSQQNNWDYWKQAWFEEPERQQVFRDYLKLRYRLIPYIYGAAAECGRTGWPMMRPLPLVYPENPAYDQCLTTYFLGDNLLVGSYTDKVTIPPGLWHEWRTDASVTGPAILPVPQDPVWGGALYVKAGAIIPTWPAKPYISGGWNKDVIFEVWPTADGAAELYEDDGLTLKYRDGQYAQVPLTVKKTAKGCVFEVGRRHGTKNATFRRPAPQQFSVVFHALAAKPTKALLDGKPAEGKWDAEKHTYRLDLGTVPVAGCKVELD